MRVVSPGCVYRREGQAVDSTQSVRITRSDLVISGRGFEWRADDEKLRIRHAARVELRGLQGSMEQGRNTP